jgi:hypothetical protein
MAEKKVRFIVAKSKNENIAQKKDTDLLEKNKKIETNYKEFALNKASNAIFVESESIK